MHGEAEGDLAYAVRLRQPLGHRITTRCTASGESIGDVVLAASRQIGPGHESMSPAGKMAPRGEQVTRALNQKRGDASRRITDSEDALPVPVAWASAWPSHAVPLPIPRL